MEGLGFRLLGLRVELSFEELAVEVGCNYSWPLPESYQQTLA